MSDLISREALKKACSEMVRGSNNSDFIPCPTWNNAMELIDNAPTVSLQDIYQEGHYDGHLEGYTKAINEGRPQGEWKHNNFDEHSCNKCGHPALWSEEADGYYEVQSNFCPNCGADMRKRSDE